MTRTNRPKGFDLWLFIKKSALSGFVIFSFIAYVIDQRILAARGAAAAQPTPGPAAQPQAALNPSFFALPGAGANVQAAQGQAQTQPTQAPATATPQGQYKDGTYNGPVTDAWYGPMQVQAIIQGGKLAQVQVLQFPQDRRTSQRINAQALPWLEQEAVQAQTASIDFISGATLTSNAFIESLQSALQSAKS